MRCLRRRVSAHSSGPAFAKKIIACRSVRNQTRALLLAAFVRESATVRFPLAMFGPRSAAQIDNRGPVPFSKEDGYSWIVALLPYVGEKTMKEIYPNDHRDVG